ncbi:DNA-binding protein YbaB [Allocatelliglobosispora scoriae]|uniref:DNA-binding protein YbaB n=1 Tax=Allocatelliglobosispora scoriae TaxID=643052 RepID=A0A841BX74_9ACTN|nr:YbaB/EbfC family nucleoid-associated protein [Allocatelliglobosispora scoriae]MBB5871330.1 DNA-binding protein YbaB [Allocatelliglobosispora scoriae]
MREIDEAWIEEAVTAYRRIEERQADYRRALAEIEVSVRSPDGLVEVTVGGEGGAVLGVEIIGSLRDRTAGDVNRAIQSTLVAARDAADWARRKLHQEIFGEYPALGGQR